jgi:predicted aspartyl protease
MFKSFILAATAATILSGTAHAEPTVTKQWLDGPIQVYQLAFDNGSQKCNMVLRADANRVNLAQWSNGDMSLSFKQRTTWASGGQVTLTVDGGTPFTVQAALPDGKTTSEWIGVTIPDEGANKGFLHDLWNGQTLHILAGPMQADFSLNGSATAILRLHQCGVAIAEPGNTVAQAQISAPGTFPVATTAPTAPAVTQPVMPASNVVPLGVDNGVYTIPLVINGHRARFVLDSGAGGVHLPMFRIREMMNEGTVLPSDFVRYGIFVDANGRETKEPIYRLRTVTVGNVTLHDIEGVGGDDPDTYLLGQAFLAQLPSYTIDNKNGRFIIGG